MLLFGGFLGLITRNLIFWELKKVFLTKLFRAYFRFLLYCWTWKFLIFLGLKCPQRVCVCVHVLNTFLISLGMMGKFWFLQVPRFVAGNFYRFKNEGYLLEVFKIRFFNRTLSIYRRFSCHCRIGLNYRLLPCSGELLVKTWTLLL